MAKSLEVIDERVCVELTKRLIKHESTSGNEKKLATLMAIEMKKAGFNLVQFDEKSYDIIGVMPGLGKGKTLVLAGYIDTVPAGTMQNPFSAQEMDGTKLGTKGKVIYGRGACDMKAALAAMISAGAALKRSRARLKGNFVIVGLASAKTGKSTNFKKLLQKFELNPDYVVACAPTNLDINIAHPGQATYEIVTKGKMTNIGNPKKGENAILKMTEIINCLLSNTELPEDKRFGKANMFFSSILSNPVGESHSVPNACQSLLVRQIFEKENPEKIREEFMNLLKKNNFKEEEIKIDIARYFKPLNINPKEEIISIIEEVINIAIGKPTKIGQWSGGANISEIFDIGLPVVGFGPGDEQFTHTPIEHVPIDQVLKATRVYSVLAEKICVQMKDKSV